MKRIKRKKKTEQTKEWLNAGEIRIKPEMFSLFMRL